jgi:hypothetical protein
VAINTIQEKMEKQFAQLKNQVEEDKDLSSNEEQSHLQFMGVPSLAKVSYKNQF